MNNKDEMNVRIERFERILKTYIPKEEGYQRSVIEAMNYSLLSGGKRLRPMLMEETFRLFKGTEDWLIEPFMAAIEMIHTYSLVHDDLPAMDNDEYRRGRKTTHVVYGETIAILAGDGLLNYAVETALKAFDNIENEMIKNNTSINNDLEEKCSPANNEKADLKYLLIYKRISKAIKILMKKAGIYGMIGGQTVDVEEFSGNTELTRLNFINKLKTAALIEASMMIGAVLAGADDSYVNQIETIARDIGIAFQIRDDILDITSTTEVLGKPIHSDKKNNKLTYATLLGTERAEEEVISISKRAISAFDELPYNNEYLRELIIKLIYRDK